ncbi:MAG: energy transducer TonB [Bacteroidia bacterium]|nr:energy transducer TonB [Bacteroidia bacterium]
MDRQSDLTATYYRTAARRRSLHILYLAALILTTECASSDTSSNTSSVDTLPSSLVDRYADSLKEVASESAGRPSSDSISGRMTVAISKPLPPPKKEPWMDTLTDLNDIPPPNAAIFLEDEPMPRNLSSVAILIAQRYKPKKPIDMTLRLYVTEEGTVRRYQLLKTSDPKLTPEYFVHPLLELRFTPATYNGKPASAWTTVSLKIPTHP